MSAWDTLDERLRPIVQASTDEYARVRPGLEAVTAEMEANLRAVFADSPVKPLFVASRTKTVESFRDKASRMLPPEHPGELPTLLFPDPLRNLTDLVGLRIIMTLPHEVDEAANLIKRQRAEFDCRGDREKDIGSIESGTYGYSSRHLILRTIQNETVREFHKLLEPDQRPNGSYLFEVQIRTVLAHAWSEIEHDIRFKAGDPRAWSPYFDRQFTATAAMLETVETAFAELHERYETVTGFWDEEGQGSAPLTPNRIRDIWMTLLPHVNRKSGDDWGWAAEMLAAHGMKTTMDLAGLLQAEAITKVRAALDHRYSPGPDRLLDDLLLWRFGKEHIDLTAEPEDAPVKPRRESLGRRYRLMQLYRAREAELGQ